MKEKPVTTIGTTSHTEQSHAHDEGKFRIWLAKQHLSVRITWKIAVAIAGIVVIVVGLILVPLPGPGWLIVFMGVALLGLEFPAAKRVSDYIKSKVLIAVAWYKDKRAARKACSQQSSYKNNDHHT